MSVASEKPFREIGSDFQLPQMRSAFSIMMLSLSAAFLLGMLVIALWAIDKGFDVSDEGFYLLSFDDPARYLCFTYAFHILKKLPFAETFNAVIQLRFLHLLSLLTGSVILCWGVTKWSTDVLHLSTFNSKIFKATLLFLTIAGSMLEYSLIQTMSYNGLTNFFLCSSIGLLFASRAYYSQSTGANSTGQLWLFIAGISTGFCLFSKITSGICLLILASCFIASFEMGAIAIYGGGVALAVLAVFGFIVSPAEILTKSRLFPLDNTHSLPILCKIYLLDFGKNLARGLIVTLPLFVLSARKFLKKGRFVPSLVIALSISVVYTIATSYLAKPNIFFAATVWCCAWCALNAIPGKLKDWWAGLTLLTFTPIVFACGTDNEFIGQASLCLSPWLLLWAIWLSTTRVKINGFIANTSLACFVMLLLSALGYQFISKLVLVPHHLKTPLFEQTWPIKETKLSGLKLDLATKSDVLQLYELLTTHGYRSGDPVIALFNKPGIVYALGGKSVGLVWFFDNRMKANVAGLQYGLPGTTNRLFLIAENTDVMPILYLDPLIVRTLDASGRPFPASFNLLGTVRSALQKGSRMSVFSQAPR